MRYKLLTVDGNPKVAKGSSQGFLTGILHLAPASLSVGHGGFNTCANATPACIAACLNTAGRGGIPTRVKVDGFANPIQAARVRRTREFALQRERFMVRLAQDIATLERDAASRGLLPAVRLNGTSDILWERVAYASHGSIMEAFPSVTFYDYTKYPAGSRAGLPRNYSLTFSRSELSTAADVLLSVVSGRNVAVVFSARKGQSLPSRYLGIPVFDADETDLRFTDRPGIAGLRAKGRAKRDASGFVVNV